MRASPSILDIKVLLNDHTVLNLEFNEYIKEAADTVFRLCQDERVRMEYEAREDHYRTQLGQVANLDESTRIRSGRHLKRILLRRKPMPQNLRVLCQASVYLLLLYCSG